MAKAGNPVVSLQVLLQANRRKVVAAFAVKVSIVSRMRRLVVSGSKVMNVVMMQIPTLHVNNRIAPYTNHVHMEKVMIADSMGKVYVVYVLVVPKQFQKWILVNIKRPIARADGSHAFMEWAPIVQRIWKHVVFLSAILPATLAKQIARIITFSLSFNPGGFGLWLLPSSSSLRLRLCIGWFEEGEHDSQQ